MKKAIILFLLGIFLIPAVSAGFSDFFTSITGFATSQTTNVSITVGNNAPTIGQVTLIPDQSVTEAGSSTVTFWFTATDVDGVSNLNDNSAQAFFTRSGETTRQDLNCSLVGDLDSTSANYSCSIDLWYFDGAGAWDINVSIQDTNAGYNENSSTSFTLLETTAMTMAPNSLTWPQLFLTDKNQTSDNDPLVINNTANKDITSGNVRVNAIDLVGESIPTDAIFAGNFTVSPSTGGSPPAECSGDYMINTTTVGITGASLPAGNNSATQGQEDLYFCLTELPQGISSQTYSTGITAPWTVSII